MYLVVPKKLDEAVKVRRGIKLVVSPGVASRSAAFVINSSKFSRWLVGRQNTLEEFFKIGRGPGVFAVDAR